MNDDPVTSYLRHMLPAEILSAEDESRRVLLDAFTLDKAVYELAYELNNRPHLVDIPLSGIRELAREGAVSPVGAVPEGHDQRHAGDEPV